MASISVTVTARAPLEVPAATVVSGTRFTCLGTKAGNTTPQVVDILSLPEVGQAASFTIEVPDDYTLSAQALDASGALLGTAASTTATIVAPAVVVVQVPSAVGATVS